MSRHTPRTIDYLRDRSDEPRPYFPLIGRLAAEISQVPMEIFLSNATQLTNAMQSAYRLFEPDAVCTGFDTTLLAEALGVDVEWDEATETFGTVQAVTSPNAVTDPTTVPDHGRLPMVTDVCERLVTSLDDPAVIGVVPGPLTTIEATFGGDAALDTAQAKPVRTAVGEFGRAFGQAGADAILVYEDVDRLGDDAADVTVETLEMLGNITDFYDMPLVLAPNGYAEATVETVLDRAQPAGVLLDTDDPAMKAEQYPDVRVGGGITADLLSAEPEQIKSQITERCKALPSTGFLASGQEVPADIHPNKLHAVHEGRLQSHE